MSVLDLLIGLIVPHECLGCLREGALLCGECSSTRLTPANRSDSFGDVQVLAACRYEGTAKELVSRFKFNGAREAAKVMAREMHKKIALLPDPPSLIVPVPTATSRVRLRGYDHTLLLARQLSRLSGVPCSRTLVRIGQSRQVGSSRAERQDQLTDSFRITDSGALRGQRVLLIDDVMTTGATLIEAHSTILGCGPESVSCLVFAKA